MIYYQILQALCFFFTIPIPSGKIWQIFHYAYCFVMQIRIQGGLRKAGSGLRRLRSTLLLWWNIGLPGLHCILNRLGAITEPLMNKLQQLCDANSPHPFAPNSLSPAYTRLGYMSLANAAVPRSLRMQGFKAHELLLLFHSKIVFKLPLTKLLNESILICFREMCYKNRPYYKYIMLMGQSFSKTLRRQLSKLQVRFNFKRAIQIH